jgi:hypothetical protein
MLVRFTRIDERRHALEVVRAVRTQRAVLETRSTLLHDLTHLAVEELAPVETGFFVELARGATLEELAARADAYAGAALQVERCVAVLQALGKGAEDPAALHARVVAALALQDEAPPPWFTADLVAAVQARLRELLGRWRATPFGGSLEVTWGAHRAQPPPAQA